MPVPQWIESLDVPVTVCDAEGVIIYMNAKSCDQFVKYGGAELLGSNLLDCHSGVAREKLVDLLANPREHTYLIEKPDKRKVIHQTPWYADDQFAGLVEISIRLPLGDPS